MYTASTDVSFIFIKLIFCFCFSFISSGGPDLQSEFDKYTKKHRHKPGEAFMIGSGWLPCGRVIYAVVPTARILDKPERVSRMTQSITNSFKIADNDKCTSIAVPLIGAMYGHFTADEIADILVGAVLKYFQANPSSNIKDVQFIDINRYACMSLKASLMRSGLEDLQEVAGDGVDGATAAAGATTEEGNEEHQETGIVDLVALSTFITYDVIIHFENKLYYMVKLIRLDMVGFVTTTCIPYAVT